MRVQSQGGGAICLNCKCSSWDAGTLGCFTSVNTGIHNTWLQGPGEEGFNKGASSASDIIPHQTPATPTAPHARKGHWRPLSGDTREQPSHRSHKASTAASEKPTTVAANITLSSNTSLKFITYSSDSQSSILSHARKWDQMVNATGELKKSKQMMKRNWQIN